MRQRIGTVLDRAKAAGYRNGENPVEGVTKGLPKQNDCDGHHPAPPYNEVPTFAAKLRINKVSERVRLALSSATLTSSAAASM
ncbi:hypothetical protein [Microvirga makkahensis]|uniref:hypothetical protein n=1 Tax=Microvirga makkahensis TaxID=1128670 RepID=UPI00197C736C|nr:hypothetical protein [Microvirga makkahensis]